MVRKQHIPATSPRLRGALISQSSKETSVSVHVAAPGSPGTHFAFNFCFVSPSKRDQSTLQKHAQREQYRKRRFQDRQKRAKEAKEIKKRCGNLAFQPKMVSSERVSERRYESYDALTARAPYHYTARKQDNFTGANPREDEEDDVIELQRVEVLEPSAYTQLATSEGAEEMALERAPSLATMLSASRKDPFESLHEPGLDAYIDAYLDCDTRLFGIRCVKTGFMPVRDICIRLAFQNRMSFLAVATFGATISPESAYQAIVLKGKTLGLVSEGLKNDVTDSLIYAVTNLWLTETQTGNFEVALCHAQGVKNMTLSRGGFKSLNFMLQMRLAWSVISLPQDISITEQPEKEYLRAGFTDLLLFSEFIHTRSTSKGSPYPAEAHAFAQHPHLYQLLAGVITDEGDYQQSPRIYNLCRLSVIFYIHAVFLEHHNYSDDIRLELQKLRDNLREMQGLEKYVTMKSLAVMVFKEGRKDRLNNPDRTMWVLRLMSAVKRMSNETLGRVLELFFGYLSGRRYGKRERAELWNVDALEREVLGREIDGGVTRGYLSS